MERCYGKEGKEGESGEKNTPEEEVEFQGCAASGGPGESWGLWLLAPCIFAVRISTPKPRVQASAASPEFTSLREVVASETQHKYLQPPNLRLGTSHRRRSHDRSIRLRAFSL